MPEALLLDTHAWLWLMMGEHARLGKAALRHIEAAATRHGVLVSAISVWELAMFAAKGRIALTTPTDVWVEKALAAPGIALAPLTPRIAVESAQLPGDFHGDPADRLLVATARIQQIPLLTADRKIIDYARTKHLHTIALRH